MANLGSLSDRRVGSVSSHTVWGSWTGHQRAGIAIWFDTPTTSTSTGMHVRTYLQNDGYPYSDNQHVDYYWGKGLFSDDFFNDFGSSGGTARLRSWDGSIDVRDSTYKIAFAMTVSGVFNGTSPHRSGEKTVPARQPRKPDAPTMQAPSQITSSSVRANYSLNSHNGDYPDRTQVRRARNSSFSSGVVARTDYSGFSYYDGHNDLDRATQYWMQVRAHNSAGWSDWSNTRSFTTDATVPDRPSEPVVQDILSDRFTFGHGPLPSDGGSSFTGMRVLVELASDGSNVRDMTVAVDSTPLLITGLTRATDYTVRFWLQNSVGQSLQSPIKSFTTAPTRTSAPRNLRVTSRGITTVSLAWDAPTDDGGRPIDYYIIQVTTDPNNWNQSAILTSNTSATFNDLVGGTRHYFRVYSYNGVGNSPHSERVDTTTFPAVAGEPYEEVAGVTSLTFAWEEVSGATQYEWELLTSPTTGVVDTGTTGTNGPITVNGLTARTDYYARVRVTLPELGSYSNSTLISTTFPLRIWDGVQWVYHNKTYVPGDDGMEPADEVFVWDGVDWAPVSETA